MSALQRYLHTPDGLVSEVPYALACVAVCLAIGGVMGTAVLL